MANTAISGNLYIAQVTRASHGQVKGGVQGPVEAGVSADDGQRDALGRQCGPVAAGLACLGHLVSKAQVRSRRLQQQQQEGDRTRQRLGAVADSSTLQPKEWPTAWIRGSAPSPAAVDVASRSRNKADTPWKPTVPAHVYIPHDPPMRLKAMLVLDPGNS